MKQKELRYKISRKAFSRFAFPEVGKGSVLTADSTGKSGKIFRAEDTVSHGQAASERSAQSRAVTLGFCAIRNFREILTRMRDDSVQLHAYLNGFIEAVADIVRRQGGAVEKFAENGILFVFGQESSEPDDLKNALLAAMKIRYRMNKLNRSWNLFHDDSWKIGIGVMKGAALVKKEKTGAEYRYSIRGNLRELARELGCSARSSQIIIPEETYKDALFPGDSFRTNEPYHVQAHSTDRVMRVREIVAMNKEREIQ